jgi:hypothetical protein
MTSGGSAYGNDRVWSNPGCEQSAYATLLGVDERRRRVLLIAATMIAARKLAVGWAERIMEEIGRQSPVGSCD